MDATTDALDAVFTGTLGYAREALTFSEGPWSGTSVRTLLDGPGLDSLIEAFEREHGPADRRAVVSYWSLWYFGGLLVPAVAATVAIGEELPLGVEDLAVRLDRSAGRVVGFELPASWKEGPMTFDALVVDHVAQVVERLTERYRVGKRLLWVNAAHYIEWTLSELATRAELADEARMARELLLERAEWPGWGRNPLQGAIRYVEEGGDIVRRRRVCCLRHMLPSVAGCGDLCPLETVRNEMETPP